MHWKITTGDGTTYEVSFLHDMPRQIDHAAKKLLESVPNVRWDAEAARRKGRMTQSIRDGPDLTLTALELTFVALRGGVPVGVFRAYGSSGCRIRTKDANGTTLVPIGPYINIGPSVCLPTVRGSGLYAAVYGIRLQLIRTILRDLNAANTKLLVGVVGNLTGELAMLYRRYPKESLFIPRQAYGLRVWRRLGQARSASKPAEVLALRHAFRYVGLKKSDGGPILVSDGSSTIGVQNRCAWITSA